jgi:hypothetical protein
MVTLGKLLMGEGEGDYVLVRAKTGIAVVYGPAEYAYSEAEKAGLLGMPVEKLERKWSGDDVTIDYEDPWTSVQKAAQFAAKAEAQMERQALQPKAKRG